MGGSQHPPGWDHKIIPNARTAETKKLQIIGMWGWDGCVPSLTNIKGHWPLPLLGAVRATALWLRYRCLSYCVTVLAFSFLFNCCLLISYYVLGTMQGNYNVHRKSNRHLLLSMHSFTCPSPPSQPHLREMPLLAMSLLWRPRLRRDSSLPSDKADHESSERQ